MWARATLTYTTFWTSMRERWTQTNYLKWVTFRATLTRDESLESVPILHLSFILSTLRPSPKQVFLWDHSAQTAWKWGLWSDAALKKIWQEPITVALEQLMLTLIDGDEACAEASVRGLMKWTGTSTLSIGMTGEKNQYRSSKYSSREVDCTIDLQYAFSLIEALFWQEDKIRTTLETTSP